MPSIAPKTASAHHRWVAKIRAETAPDAPTALGHYTSDAHRRPVASRVQSTKFNPLIIFKNLKGEYLYAITLH
jgi:hypothetical protein